MSTVPVSTPPIGSVGSNTRASPICNGAIVTRKFFALNPWLPEPATPTTSTRLVPDRRSANATSASTRMAAGVPASVARPVSSPRRGTFTVGTSCSMVRVSIELNASCVSCRRICPARCPKCEAKLALQGSALHGQSDVARDDSLSPS